MRLFFGISLAVAVLPKKEWFIYHKGQCKKQPATGRSPTQKGVVHLFSRRHNANSYLVAVLPKKEGFIYQMSPEAIGFTMSQSYPKRRGSSMCSIAETTPELGRSPTQKGVVHLSRIGALVEVSLCRSPTQKGVVHLWHIYDNTTNFSVAVLPKKEGFIYFGDTTTMQIVGVAVLPKKK